MVRVMTREEILARKPVLKTVPITIKEWGGQFFVREFDGEQREEWEDAIRTAVGASVKQTRALTVVRALVHENGERVFKDEDADALNKDAGRILARVSNIAQRLNKLGEEGMEEAKGNSEPDRSGDSAST